MIAVSKLFHLFFVFFVIAAPATAKEIHEAVQQGNLVKVKMLLENNPNLLEARSENEKTPLHFAAQGGFKYIINSHLHFDHAACNSIGGESTTFINLQNLEKMASERIIKRTNKPIKNKLNKTFKIQYSMDFNGEEIRLIPCAGIHSETDLIIYLTDSGVVHMGDLLISESFPSVGENVVEYMEFLEKVIDTFPADTKFISGHGKDSVLEDVKNYQRMLLGTIEIVRNHMKAGKSVEQMRSEKVLKDYETWNTFIPFLNTDYWIQAVYDSYKTSFSNL